MMKIAIVGAGMSGLACADRLNALGHQVKLFDKARGPGGRMSTRRMSTDAGEASFDHGAQYFTVRDARFQSVVDSWHAAGVAEPWLAVGIDAWVGTPSMNAPIKWMAARHDVAWSTRIEAIQRQGNEWVLLGEGVSPTCFDAVVVAVPAEQAAVLLAPIQHEFSTLAKATVSAPCWTLMLAFTEPLKTEVTTLKDDPVIGWAACNSTKPARTGPHSWVVQASAQWSIDHLENTQESVQVALTQRLAECLGISLPVPLVAVAHRWRYAQTSGSGHTGLYDPAIKLGVCGDWLLAPRVECAWLSGQALAELMLK